jgi:hypothetical protein
VAALDSSLRLVLCALAFSGWLLLLFGGYAFGGAVHLLLAAGLALLPWRRIREIGR